MLPSWKTLPRLNNLLFLWQFLQTSAEAVVDAFIDAWSLLNSLTYLLEEAETITEAKGADRVRTAESRRGKGGERTNQIPTRGRAGKISAETDFQIQTPKS